MGGKKRCGDDEDLLREDDLIQILVWLPIVSLLRFKSVCKSWFALIESSFFIDLHTVTTFNSNSSKFGSFIFHVADFKKLHSDINLFETAILVLSSSDSESSSSSRLSRSGSESSGSISPGGWCWSTGTDVLCGQGTTLRAMAGEEDDSDDDDEMFKLDDDDDKVVFKLDNLGIPSYYKFSHVPRMVGSCNGLICLFDGHHMFDEQPHFDFSLWNPATRQFRILPKSITIEKALMTRLVAFGFDVETKDYKVVLLAGFKPRMCLETLEPLECLCRVQVYSLSTDSWRLLEGITCLPGCPFETFEGLYLNGSCFFISRFLHSEQHSCYSENNKDRFIISFDFTKEIFTTMQLPDHRQNHKLYLCFLGDQMALFTVCDQSPPGLPNDSDDTEIYDYADFDIWVLNKELESSFSWTKLHSFQIKSMIAGEVNIPKGISDDGEFALLESLGGVNQNGLCKRMKLYNLVTKEVKKNFLSCNGVLPAAVAYVYKPSLVSVMGGGNGTTEAHRVMIAGAM